jgi:hypothetical protein
LELITAFYKLLYEDVDDAEEDSDFFDSEPYGMLLSYLRQRLERIRGSQVAYDTILRKFGIDLEFGSFLNNRQRYDADIRVYNAK